MHEYLADSRLRKDEKLLKGAQFDAVFKQGRSAGNKVLVLHWMDNGLGHPRLGLVVSRRFGGAVQRNAWKRRIRELFRLNKRKIGARDVVVLPSKQPGARQAGFDELEQSFLKLLRRMGGTDSE